MDIKETKDTAQNLIKFFSKVLDIQETITLKTEKEHPLGMAAVRKLKNGVEVDDDSEDYDQFEIIIYDNEDMRQSFDEQHQFLLLVTDVIHELLHVKYPVWDEDSIADEEARLHGLFMDYLEKKVRHQ